MGNRAVIQFTDTDLGIYLHWNGGRNSVEAFLALAKEAQIRTTDTSYRMSRLCQIIGNALGGTESLGIDLVSNLDCDNCDNGTYIVSPELDIIDRKFFSGQEQESERNEEYQWVLNANEQFFPALDEDPISEWHEDALHDEVFEVKESIIDFQLEGLDQLLAKLKQAKKLQEEIDKR